VRKGRKVLVFCNTMGSCRAVEHFCVDNSIPSVCYHGDMPIPQRKEAMEAFAGANPEGGQPIMVCTDLAARGLDFPGQVEHVVNFDFPYSPVDYLHRTGRTARAGRKGKITSIYTSKERVLANRIEWALQHDEPLDRLTNDRDVLPPSQQRRPVAAVTARGPAKGSSKGYSKGSSKGSSKAGGPKPGGAKAVVAAAGKPGVKVSLKGLRGAARVEAVQKVAAAKSGGGRPGGRSGASAGRGKSSAKGSGRR
jgi:superfamily II DNA/RNA helicase